MWRICLLLVLLVAVAGCAATGDKPGFFDEARKDWNGDNMKMRSDTSSLTGSADMMMMSRGR